VSAQDIRSGLLHAEVAGRFQVLPGRPQVILDVAHNPHAARALAAALGEMPKSGKVIAVFAMFKDKDIAGVAAAVKDRITHWLVADSPGPRGTTAADVASILQEAGVRAPIMQYTKVVGAWAAACETASVDDKIVVFGSFITVAAVMRERQRTVKRPH